jgi:hypothetical protein
MSLSCLATVELQLIMQCCDVRSLLALARSNHVTLSAASARFAWKSVLPLECICGQDALHPTVISAQVHSSLVRFGHIILRWNLCGENADASILQQDIAAISTLPLVEVVISGEGPLQTRRLRWFSDSFQQSNCAEGLTRNVSEFFRIAKEFPWMRSWHSGLSSLAEGTEGSL